MKGSDLIAALKQKFKENLTDKALADKLGITASALVNWKGRKTITTHQLARLVYSARGAGAKNLQTNAIRPLVEFFRIDKRSSRGGSKYEIFNVTLSDGSKHPYLSGLRKELEKHRGVYIFFDSRGHAIYAGKARQQSLWGEMKNAFNRKRGDIQNIKRVRHPANKKNYLTHEEKARQIYEYEVPLHDLATYFSAYQVANGLIDEIEAMLVRSFANDLLNKKMEKFGKQGRKKAKSKKKKKKSA